MTDRNSVLIVGNFLAATGGPPSACEDLARQMRGDGWTVVTTSTRAGRVARLSDMLSTAWRKRGQYRLAAIDTFSGPAFFWAEAVASTLRVLGKPYVLALRGGRLPGFARDNTRRVTRLFGSAAAVAAPSRYLQESMRQYRDGILLIPNAIDVSNYPFRVRTRPVPHMMWLRAFHAVYNPRLALRVLAELAPRQSEARLTMVGPDKRDGSLQSFLQEAKDLHLEGRVECTGAVSKNEVPSRLNQGDIFLNTTNIDNTPVSVVEAMACGMCVVSTSVGGIPYLLEHGRDSLLVPPNDPKAMVLAVGRILTESGLAEFLSRNARRKAKRFDWKAVLPQWLALFAEVPDHG